MAKQIKRITDVAPQQANANRHTQRGMAALERSIQQDGHIGAITVAADGETFDGSARVEVDAALFGDVEPIVVRSNGDRPIIHIREDIPSASDPRAVRLGIAANRVPALNLDFDPAILTAIAAQDIDLSALFTEAEWAGVAMPDEPPEPGAGGDKFDASPIEGPTRTALGDLWLIDGGRHRLAVGDSTDPATVARLMGGERAGLTVYDPPWDSAVYTDVMGDVLVFTDGRRTSDTIARFGAPTWVFVWDCGSCWYTPNRPLQRMKLCFWYGAIEGYHFDGAHYGTPDKAHTATNSRGSYAYVPDRRGKHLADLYAQSLVQLHSTGDHPHEKPVDWMKMLIANCSQSPIIYDPFLGSGASIIAAHRVGRRCFGVEIAPRFADTILRRAESEGLTVTRERAADAPA